jgi:hypothetical protein
MPKACVLAMYEIEDFFMMQSDMQSESQKSPVKKILTLVHVCAQEIHNI